MSELSDYRASKLKQKAEECLATVCVDPDELLSLLAAIAERDQRIAELEASEVRARHNLCELMADLGQEPDRNDPTLTPCILAFQASVFVKRQRYEMQERIAELTAMLNDEIGDRDKCCQCRFDIDDEYTPIKVCEYHQRMQERANEWIAELERERDELRKDRAQSCACRHELGDRKPITTCLYHGKLSDDLAKHVELVRTMGARCDKLAGMLHNWLACTAFAGELQKHETLITETETLLREVGQ